MNLLSEYRVLDLADESGVYGAKLLADMGAEVIKVETPGGDPTRRLPPFLKDRNGSEHSLYFAYMNTSKRSITLNLETVEGQALFRDLAKRVDAVYETTRPGYMTGLGIGYRELSELNPSLIWVSVTPFGQTGPRRDWKGSNLIGWATAGLLHCTGYPDRPPVVPGGTAPLAYYLASLNAGIGTLLALQARRLVGRGQLVDISVQEAAFPPELGIATFVDDLTPRVRAGNRRPATSPNGLYPCQDGYALVLVSEPRHWDAFAEWVKEKVGVEVTDPLFRERGYRGQVYETIDKWTEALTLQYTKQALFEEGQRRGITITPANSAADLARDPHLEARNYWEEVSHASLGPLRMPGAPFRFARTPCHVGPPPTLGEHNDAIYGDELGLSKDDLCALEAKGVI